MSASLYLKYQGRKVEDIPNSWLEKLRARALKDQVCFNCDNFVVPLQILFIFQVNFLKSTKQTWILS